MGKGSVGVGEWTRRGGLVRSDPLSDYGTALARARELAGVVGDQIEP